MQSGQKPEYTQHCERKHLVAYSFADKVRADSFAAGQNLRNLSAPPPLKLKNVANHRSYTSKQLAIRLNSLHHGSGCIQTLAIQLFEKVGSLRPGSVL